MRVLDLSGLSGLLRNRNFTLLWIGQIISSIGDSMHQLALTWYVFQATGSALETSGVLVASYLASLIGGLMAGALADRLNRKALMVFCDVARAAVVLLAVLLALSDRLTVPVTYVIAFTVTILSLPFGPSRAAIKVEIVGREQIVRADAFERATFSTIQLLGLMFGGIVIALVGATAALAVDAFSFLVSGAAILLIRYQAAPAEEALSWRPAQLLGEIREGIRFVVTSPLIRPVMLAGVLANFGSGLYGALTPVLVGTVLHGGSEVFGYVEVAMVAGGICGSVLVSVISRLNPMTGVAAGLAGTGLCAIGTGLSPSLWLTLALFFLMGLSLSVTNAPLIGALQTHTPQHMMGRMFSAFGTSMSLVAPAAIAFGGRLSDWMGPGKVFMLGGAMVLTTAIGFLVLTPKERIRAASHMVS